MKRQSTTLTLPISTSNGSNVSEEVDLGRYSSIQSAAWLKFVGTFSATYVVETSMDGGTTWDAPINGALMNDLTPTGTPQTNITAAGVFVLYQLHLMRIRCTVYVSGTPTCIVNYADETPYA